MATTSACTSGGADSLQPEPQPANMRAATGGQVVFPDSLSATTCQAAAALLQGGDTAPALPPDPYAMEWAALAARLACAGLACAKAAIAEIGAVAGGKAALDLVKANAALQAAATALVRCRETGSLEELAESGGRALLDQVADCVDHGRAVVLSAFWLMAQRTLVAGLGDVATQSLRLFMRSSAQLMSTHGAPPPLVAKFAMAARELVQLHTSRDDSLPCFQEALEMLRVCKGAADAYPKAELEWLIVVAWNSAAHHGQARDWRWAQRWVGIATGLLDFSTSFAHLRPHMQKAVPLCALQLAEPVLQSRLWESKAGAGAPQPPMGLRPQLGRGQPPPQQQQ